MTIDFSKFVATDDQPQPQAGTMAQTQTAQSRRFEILTASDALQPQPPIKWVVDGLISAGSVNIFFGESGSKKTWSLLDMGTCVARGDAWLNFSTQAGNVLLIDEDNGRNRMMRRMGQVLRGHNADDKTPLFCVSYAAFDFGKVADAGEFTALINTTNARLVIIDALADIMPGRDENSVKDVQPIFAELRRVAEDTQAAIIVIHHANKNGGYRGSSAIKGKLDLMVLVESKKDSDEITFKTEKERDTKESSFVALANFSADAFWLTPTQKTVKATAGNYNKAERYALLYLFQNGESTSKAMTDNIDPQIDPAPKSINNAVSNLKGRGLIVRTDNGNTSTGTYKLTPEGERDAESL